MKTKKAQCQSGVGGSPAWLRQCQKSALPGARFCKVHSAKIPVPQVQVQQKCQRNVAGPWERDGEKRVCVLNAGHDGLCKDANGYSISND